MDNKLPPDVLTHDEKKAAEAAFAGRPFNPKWSKQARSVYDGIVKALPTPLRYHGESTASSEEEGGQFESTLVEPVAESEKENEDGSSAQGEHSPAMILFQQAIVNGTLIDVTPAAQQLGFSFPVTLTKPLWEIGIAPGNTISQEEQSQRLRDILMAFRLRLASQPTVSPLIDFPALLAFPPNSVPQPIPLFALIQPDEQNRATVTLLMPNEVAANIIPLN